MLFVCLPGELAEQEEKEPRLRSSPPSKEGEIVCAATLKMSIFLRSFLFVLFFLGRHAGDIIKVRLSFISTTLDQSISTTLNLL